MASFDNLSSTQKIRATLHRDVRSICTETCHFLGLEITKDAMEIVAELVYKKLSVYGTDLEAFAKHAKRTTINSDDVKLLVRRNPSLKSHLNALTPASVGPKEKRRKTVALPINRPETPVSKQKETEVLRAIEVTKQKEPDELRTNEIEDKVEKQMAEAVDSMAVDDTIDLTFD